MIPRPLAARRMSLVVVEREVIRLVVEIFVLQNTLVLKFI